MTATMTRRLYVTAWLMLGAISLVYFFTLFQSVIGTNKTHSSMSTAPFSIFAKNTTAPADASVSKALAHMRGEIDQLKTSLEAANRENAALKVHIGTLETAFGQSPTASLPSGPEAIDMSEEMGEDWEEDSVQPAPAPNIEVTMLPMPADGFAAEGLLGSPLPITGQGEPTRTLFGIELASGLNPDAVAKRWKWLKLRHDKLLDQLKPRAVKVLSSTGSTGGDMTLVAGPFTNAAAAARLCARLIAAGATCKGTRFAGSPVGSVAAR